MTWISPDTIIGDAATGSKYFARPNIHEEFWREIKKGNHILFVAPRRVGKTSIMRDLAENCSEEYVCLYQDIEGVKSRNEFYERLYDIIIQCHRQSALTKVQSAFKDLIAKHSITEVGPDGVKIAKHELDYEAKLRELIPELAKAKVHTVIFLDEFAEVINKLKKKGHADDAVSILHTLREIRSINAFKHFSVVYAGSIGLEFVIRQIDRPKLINDLYRIRTEALTHDEAVSFIRKLVLNATIQIDMLVEARIIQVIGNLLPYFIQLMVQEMDANARKINRPIITEEDVEQAAESIVAQNKNFEDWIARLKEYQADNFSFINHILRHAAHKGKISIQEIYNIASAKKYKRQDDYMDFADELVNDGYLIKSGPLEYKFLSPFLQRFWLRKYPVL